MKNWIYVLLGVFVLGCSNKYEGVLASAPAQGLSCNKDTIAIREKDYYNILFTDNGRLTIYCTDPAHQVNLLREDTSSAVHVIYRGDDIMPGKSLPVADSVQVYITADAPGLYSLSFYLMDRLGRVKMKNVLVNARANQSAVASFFYRSEAQSNSQSWPFYFDGSYSSKADGVITMYHYSVNGQAIDSRDPIIHWTFHAKGDHIIGLSVTDDLGQQSAIVYQKITIQ